MPTKRQTSSAARVLILLLSCTLFALSCAAVTSEQEPCSPSAKIVQVADGIYVRPGQAAVVFEGERIANTGFVVGDRCVAVVDTGGSMAEGQALDCAIRTVSDRSVCYVINTHVHPDHLLGNAAFVRPGVEFVAHAKLPRALALRGDLYLERASAHEQRELNASQIVFPERTVATMVELDIGGRVLTIRAHRSAHTDHDLSVKDSRTNTAFLGDLVFLEHLPVIDGSINGWIGELEQLSEVSISYVVPGHGPPRTDWPAAAQPALAYLTALRESVRAWIANGGDLASAQDTIDAPQGAAWQLVERYHERNVGAAFAELEWED